MLFICVMKSRLEECRPLGDFKLLYGRGALFRQWTESLPDNYAVILSQRLCRQDRNMQSRCELLNWIFFFFWMAPIHNFEYRPNAVVTPEQWKRARAWGYLMASWRCFRVHEKCRIYCRTDVEHCVELIIVMKLILSSALLRMEWALFLFSVRWDASVGDRRLISLSNWLKPGLRDI